MTDAELRPLRIIAIAMISGPAIFLAVAVFLRSQSPLLERAGEPVVTWAALVVGLSVIVVSFLLPRPAGGDAMRVRGHIIARLALVEGGALFGTVAYFVEEQWSAVAMSALCLALMCTLHFPTRERCESAAAERH